MFFVTVHTALCLEQKRTPNPCADVVVHGPFRACISTTMAGANLQFHSYLLPLAFAARPLSTLPKAFGTSLLLLAKGSFTVNIYRLSQALVPSLVFRELYPTLIYPFAAVFACSCRWLRLKAITNNRKWRYDLKKTFPLARKSLITIGKV